MIFEGIVTTLNPDGSWNVAPMGPEFREGSSTFVLKPFRSSTTYRNLLAHRQGVWHASDDVLLLARAAIGLEVDPEMRPATRIEGRILVDCCRFREFRVVEIDDRGDRALIRVETVAEGRGESDWPGLNRARHAVVEAAILATRTDFLPLTEILADFARLAAPVEKTGGAREREAFALLLDHVRRAAVIKGIAIERGIALDSGGCNDLGWPGQSAACPGDDVEDRGTLRFAPATRGRDPESRATPDRMTEFRIVTPSRLHFGLFGWGEGTARQFGGVGLMIDRPGLSLSAKMGEKFSARGPLSEKALGIAERVASRLRERGIDVPPLEFEIHRAPGPHVGLGSGTQLALAVARLIAEASGTPTIPAAILAEWSGRGLRSGVGLHGFDLGGLIVDGGRRIDKTGGFPPLLARMEIPGDWSVLVVVPPSAPGLHGPDETAAFRRLPPVPEAITDRLCRLALLGLMPAVAEADIDAFGSSLAEIQRLVGSQFAPAQGGGVFAGEESARIATWMQSEGVRGVGQSSWGPTLYGFSSESMENRMALIHSLRDRFSIAENDAFWTTASRRGAVFEAVDRP